MNEEHDSGNSERITAVRKLTPEEKRKWREEWRKSCEKLKEERRKLLSITDEYRRCTE